MRGRLRQFLAASIATVGVLSFGAVLSWTSPALPKLQTEGYFGNITSKQSSWISSIATLGAAIASPVAGVSVDYFGRKNTMLFLAYPFVFGWVLIGFAKNLPMLCIGRLITGMCGGGYAVAAPVFISEIAEDHIRGVLASFFQLMLVIGILFTDVVGTYVSWDNLAFISSGFPLISFFLMLSLPESPRALLYQKKGLSARTSLYWFRGASIQHSNKAVEKELLMIEESVEMSRNFNWKEIFQSPMRRPIVICLSLVIFKSPVIIFYAFNIFRSTGTLIDYNLSMWIVGIVQVLAVILSSLLVDKVGRRILLISSEAVMALSLFALGTFFHLNNIRDDSSPTPHIVQLQWLPLVSLALFIISFSVGLGPLSWIIQSEILPLNIKGVCSSIATTFVWLLAFVITNTYKMLADEIGCDWAFWLFAGICFGGAIFSILVIPETKGKSLEEIQRLFA